jgi:hypothetical protein
MKTGINWYVEIIQAQGPTGQAMRIEPCASLEEARKIAEQVEEKVDFDPAKDRIAIYRGVSWATAKLYE